MTVMDLNRSSVELAGKTQLQAYGQFLQQFSDQISNLEECYSFSSNPFFNPISVQFSPEESASVLELVRSGNVPLDKVVCALAALCVEVDSLKAEVEAKFYPALLIYGEDVEKTSDADGGSGSLKMIGQMLPCLQELSVFVDRCYEVVRNVVHQFAALYHSLPQKALNVSDVHLDFMFETVGKVLGILITLDEIIGNHFALKDHWKTYRKTVHVAQHNPEKFSVDKTELKPLQTVLEKLDGQLMSGYILQNCVEQPFDTKEINVSQNTPLMEEFSSSIRILYSKFERKLEEGSTTDKRDLAGLCGLYVLYFFVFRVADKKTFRTLWDSYKKTPAFHLIGDIVWTPASYLLAKLPQLQKAVDKKGKQTVETYRSFAFQQHSNVLIKEAQNGVLKVSEWSLQMKKRLDVWSTDINAELARRCNLFLEGLRLADSISTTVKTTLNAHLMEGWTMQKTSALALFRLIEVLKEIENVFYKHWLVVLESCSHICQRSSGLLLQLLSSAKEMLKSDKRYSERKVDMLASFMIAEKALAGPATRERWLVLNLAICIGNHAKLLRTEETLAVSNILEKVQKMANLGRELVEACDCSFLFWHRSLFPVYFDYQSKEGGSEPRRISQFFTAINDCFQLIEGCRHAPMEKALEHFEKEVHRTIEESFLKKLCEVIETDLRLSIHTHLQLDSRSPFRGQEQSHVAPLFDLPPLRLRKHSVDIKRYVEIYLEKTFYNLTTVALHDWKSYAEMRQLARQKYGLNISEPHLPSQTLEQGLDVLVIMRNLHIFVQDYMYNLNTQCFVQKQSKNKYLETLGVRHIANSIRTHGTGIMSTAVNFTYQYFKKKFYIFSQFLYDDHIKSRLLKDAKFFRDKKIELEGKYPMEKAEKFNRGIRKLGMTKHGNSYLDEFRNLITQIGNALGYVRLVRTGGLQACSQAIQFIPDLDDIVPLAPLCSEARLSNETQEAATNFDSLVSNLIKNFAEGTEYFKLLVDVFAPEFRNPKHVHLKNFYVIVPPLTINFVEHMLACKDRIGKKGQITSAAFTDDGFAMGVAYILKLLEQYEEFDSLQWFRSVDEKFAKDKVGIEKQHKMSSAGATLDEKLQQTLSLSMKRSDQYRKEFDLVFFALRSARIFFRTDVESELIPKDKDVPSENSSAKSGTA